MVDGNEIITVSIIVPVYKVEQYLHQCVSSLTCQTYSRIEIILVDDGSPDSCPAICDTLAKEDPRIRVIHKENGGLSDARNVGLQSASGEYVMFVDGDDFWQSSTVLQRLICFIKPELDFIGYNCSYFYPESKSFSPWVPFVKALTKPVDKNKAIISLIKSGTFPMSACLKLMRRSFLINNSLFFKKGQIAEDIPWFINLLDATNECCFVNEYVYAYRQNVIGSITNSDGRKSFDSLFDIFKSELSRIDTRSFNSEAKEALKSFLAYEYCILLTYLRHFKRAERKGLRKELYSYRTILRHTDNPKVRKAAIVNKLFGIRATEFTLDLYQYRRKMKK